MKEFLNEYIFKIFSWNKTDRVWEMPVFAGLGVFLVLFCAALLNKPHWGLVAIIGANIFLYVPNTPIYHKMVQSMAAGFGMSLCFTLGLIAQIYPNLAGLIVGLVSLVSAQVVRYFSITAPGFYFFTFACILGTFIPFEMEQMPLAIGLVSLGTIVANAMVLLYSLCVIYIFKNQKISPTPSLAAFGFGVVIIDPVIIAFFVGGSMYLQQFLGLERGYWVSVSCAAVLTAITFKQIWIKQIQRILGTALGVAAAFWLLHYTFTPLQFAALMGFLMFFAELVVKRNYALAMVFLTPYSTYLAEVSSFMNYDPQTIISARILDIALGSLIGLIGGACLHWEGLRKVLELILRKAIFWKWGE